MNEQETGAGPGSIGPDGNPPSHRLSRSWLIGGAAVVALLGFGVWHGMEGGKRERPQTAQVVNVAKAVRGDMPILLNEIGTVTPTATVTVLPNANVSGYLTRVAYREGETVQKGQLLAEIDSRPYQVQRQQAQAALAKDQALLDQARYDYSLYDQLNAKKAIAGQTYTDQKFAVQQYTAAVQQDKANIAQYDLDIQYCHIVAPVSGRAGLRLVDPGNYVTGSSSTGIVVLTTVKPMLVQFGVAQNDIGKVAARFAMPGVKLPVTAFDSSTHKPIATGTLYAISNQMNAGTGQTLMRASFGNDDGALWPSAFVDVRVLVDTMKGATLVPATAVLSGAPGTYVYLVNPDRTVSIRKIATGPSDGQHVVVTSGLAPGDTVVTDGTDRLTDHAKIRLASEHRPGGGDGSGRGAGGARHRRGSNAG